MTCPNAASGCNSPQSECLGLCLHRAQINTDTMSKPLAAIKGRVEQRMPIEFAEPKESALTCALSAYRTHRPAGRIKAIRQAFKAWSDT